MGNETSPAEAGVAAPTPERVEVTRKHYEAVPDAVEAMYSMISANAYPDTVLFTLETYPEEGAAVLLIHLVY